jgi:hypothetical protein
MVFCPDFLAGVSAAIIFFISDDNALSFIIIPLGFLKDFSLPTKPTPTLSVSEASTIN